MFKGTKENFTWTQKAHRCDRLYVSICFANVCKRVQPCSYAYSYLVCRKTIYIVADVFARSVLCFGNYESSWTENERAPDSGKLVKTGWTNKNSRIFTDTSLHALDKNKTKIKIEWKIQQKKEQKSTFDRKHINCMVLHMVWKTSIRNVSKWCVGMRNQIDDMHYLIPITRMNDEKKRYSHFKLAFL